MKATIGGKTWHVVRRRIRPAGWCYFDDRRLEIKESLRGKELLDTLLHEVGHAAMPWMTEEHVADLAEAQAEIVMKYLDMIVEGGRTSA